MCDYRVAGAIQIAGEPGGSEQNGPNVQVKSQRLSELVRLLEDSWDYLYDYNATVVPQISERNAEIEKMKQELADAKGEVKFWFITSNLLLLSMIVYVYGTSVGWWW
jgi:hypothetical protein